jgi:hypothetical protein
VIKSVKGNNIAWTFGVLIEKISQTLLLLAASFKHRRLTRTFVLGHSNQLLLCLICSLKQRHAPPKRSQTWVPVRKVPFVMIALSLPVLPLSATIVPDHMVSVTFGGAPIVTDVIVLKIGRYCSKVLSYMYDIYLR